MRHEIPVSVRNPVVGAHRFDGRHLLPGLAYIDILFQAFANCGIPVGELELRDLAIHRALVVSDEVVRLGIDASGDGEEWLVHVDGHIDGLDPSHARRHAVATMARQRQPMRAFDHMLDWNAIQASSAPPLAMHEIYDASARMGLEHGEYMKAEGVVYTTDEAIYVDCQLGAGARADADALLFHPALVDGCVVGATAVLSTLDPHGYEAALPLSYGRFRASRPLGAACMARVMRDSVRRENGLTWLSMDFFDLEGRKIAELRDFASKRLPPSRKLAHDDDGGTVEIATGSPPPSGTATAPSDEASSLAAFIRDAVARRLRVTSAAIRSDLDFYELGIDSTGLLELAHAIAVHLGRKLPPTLLFQFSTVEEVVAHLLETSASATPLDLQRSSPTPLVPDPSPVPSPSVSIEQRRDDGIAVIGLSGRFPQASDIERFWEKLRAGADCIGMVPPERWDVARDFDPRKGEPGKTYGKWGGFIDGVDAFDPLFFGMSPREAELTDPQQRLFLETVWNLLEDSGYTRERLRTVLEGKVGVYAGSMYSQYDHLAPSSPIVLQSFQSGIANRVSHYFGLSGPSVAVDTMCSSFAVALHQACADLGRGDVAMAIAGAVNLSLDARKFVGLSQALLLASRYDARSFADGDGYFPSETVGAVLLKPLWMAERDGDEIWGVIRATAVNHAGSGQAYSVPNGHAQVGVMRDVLRRANVSPGEIGYVEAAATGAAISDAIEWSAIAQVFDGQTCPIGSVKSNMGHAEAASGLSQLAKVLLQLRHGELVPTIGTEPPNPNLRLDEAGLRLQRHREPWARPVRMDGATPREMPRLALINSFGAGGSNASLVVEEYRGATVAPARRAGRTGAQVIVLSGRNASGRRAVAARLVEWLEGADGIDLADLAYTLQEHREAMDWRLALVATDAAGLLATLRRYLASAGEGVATWHEGDPSTALSEDAVPHEGGDADRLAWAWARHRPVDWSASRGAGPFRRIVLPTYPFERQRCWLPEATAAENRPVDSDDTQTVVRVLLERALRVPENTLDGARPFREYGVDSVVGLGLIRALNDRFAMRLGGRVLFEHPTIDRLVKHVATLRRHDVAVPTFVEGEGMRGALREFKAGRLTRDQLKARLERNTAA